MATVKRFAEPVSDEQEIVLRGGAIPTTTKNSTEWGTVFGTSGHKPEKNPILQLVNSARLCLSLPLFYRCPVLI